MKNPEPPTPCECQNWCDVDSRHRLLTNHHANCSHSPKALDKALELIADLAKGIEAWGAEEDGIYPTVWESYIKAKALQGKFLPFEEEGEDKKCQHCGKSGAKTYRQDTYYTEESANYVTLCRECRKINDEYWEEMWNSAYEGEL